uniref:Pyroglutamylated RFamide peptide n=2 Tax=Anas TaxID=8835 RepID=A0A493SV17_ANAPP
MRAPSSLSCLFLLTLGACFPPGEPQQPQHPAEGPALQPGCREELDEAPGPCWWPNPKRRRSEELSTLLGIARELRGSGTWSGGSRGQPGRQEGPAPLPAGGEKRGGTLGNLAEELSGYSRKKGGFTFRFGRGG